MNDRLKASNSAIRSTAPAAGSKSLVLKTIALRPIEAAASVPIVYTDTAERLYGVALWSLQTHLAKIHAKRSIVSDGRGGDTRTASQIRIQR